MKFSKVSYNSKGVHLVRQTKTENGAVEKFDLESPEAPLKSFVDALQKFKDYVVALLPFLTETELECTVTTINLSETKDGRRGLMVSVTVPIESLNGKAVSITTPVVHEEPEESNSDEMRYLSDDEMKLIGLLEKEATRYYGGEREQGEMFADADASDNTKAFSDRSAAAEVASTRKPRATKAKPAADGAFAPAVVQ